MQLTKKDIKLLLSVGYTENDLQQIKTAAKFCKITDAVTDKRITQKDFIKLCGKGIFLITLARAAFHYTSSYVFEVGTAFIFDCGKMFERC